MNIIEPCCAERQLGYLLREERGRVMAFQTHGDVTLKHFLQAVMLMSGDRPRTLTLAVPIFTEAMMNNVAKYMRLEWVAKFRLMTTDHLPKEIIEQFALKIGCDVSALLERIELAADASIPDCLLAFSGPDGTVAIQGRIYGTVMPGLTLYAGIYGRTEGAGVRTVMDAWNANFRARRYQVAMESEKPKKKRTTRKNIKNNETESMEAVAGAPQSEEEAESAE